MKKFAYPRPVRPRAVVIIEDSSFDAPVEESSLEYEPYEILQRKIEAMMEITGATEEEAERMILNML